MKAILINCPSCFGRYDGKITDRFLTCEYCGTRFALGEDELEALGMSGGGGNDEGYDDYEDDGYEYNEGDDLLDVVQEEVEDCLCRVDRGNFRSSQKILNGLGIDENEEDVYLIHDDTMFKSGKNGFAITSEGLYCREMGERHVNFMSWEDLAKTRYAPIVDDSYIRIDGQSVAYYTDGSDDLEQLEDLYNRLSSHATYFYQ